ncbi:unnamed protein product [Blepharisma stoltei]|uniref:Aspartyl/asparaginy/proline hydroxylase domain-containing protein n=1 Tax=Blepharisma stoltei TaxID=1481888 RepID=A0AAU9J2D6_9CILI|nr:unnamed protein product [Blepharisma stoltei]
MEETSPMSETVLMEKIQKFFDEFHLNALQRAGAMKFIKEKISNPDDLSVNHIREWMLAKLNNKRIPPIAPMQRGCPEIIPGLRAHPWWDANEFPWIRDIEANYEVIKSELLALYNKGGFQPYRGPSWAVGIPSQDVGTQSHTSGDWNVFYLYLHGMSFDENLAKCPETVRVINTYVPRHYEHAFFSALNPGTHVLSHHGPTNKKLRLHLPIVDLSGTRLRAAEETRTFEEGKVAVFDDSFDHEAWHEGTTTRVNLIIDFWHPDLSDDEVKFLKIMQKSKIRAEKEITSNEQDTFYSVIERAKDIRPGDNSWWCLSEENERALIAAGNKEE